MTRVLLSGVQPSGRLHLGNYLAVIKPWLQMHSTKKYEKHIFQVADLHALTNPGSRGVSELATQTFAQLLAAGLQSEAMCMFRQSMVPEHLQFAWLLLCRTKISKLERMIQWKEKSATLDAFAGLLAYPVLQAADILLYNATDVMVGPDQKQHMELTADVAQSLNSQFPDLKLTPPKAIIGASKICSLRAPNRKMSKSASSSNGIIYLDDSPETISVKIRGAITDSSSSITYDVDARPGISNLIKIYSLVSDLSVEGVVQKYSGLRSSLVFKDDLTDILASHLKTYREAYSRISGDRAFLESALEAGSQQAREIASKNFEHIRRVLGV